MNKKGQAAMEFLMTYGWAILAAIIAIAVLAYFGVFNPGRYTSEMCQLGAPFTCDDNSYVQSGIANAFVNISLRNGGDEDYTITNLSVQNCGAGGADVLIASGVTTSVSVTCDNELKSGAAFRGNIEIGYVKVAGGTRTLTATGSITRKKIA